MKYGMSKDESIEYYSEIYTESMISVYTFTKSRKIQSWQRIDKAKAKRLWNQFMKLSFVPENMYDILDNIANILIVNCCKIQIYSELLGGTIDSPEDILSLVGEFTEDDWEFFSNNTYDAKLKFQLSTDVASPNLNQAAMNILKAKTPEDRLIECDQTLNIIHIAGSLADRFIEGGRNTLDDLFKSQKLEKLNMITKFSDFLNESITSNYLYHAIKIDYAKTALATNTLDAYTFQRYWPDGIRRKDDEPDYYKSYYYRGISLTRNVQYALKWNDIVFVFDQSKLRTKYKIIPYNWGYSIGGGYRQDHRAKRESEEFLIVSKIEKSLTNNQLIKVLETPGGKIENLDKYLIGFYISKRILDIYTNDKRFNELIKHPLYLGEK